MTQQHGPQDSQPEPDPIEPQPLPQQQPPQQPSQQPFQQQPYQQEGQAPQSYPQQGQQPGYPYQPPYGGQLPAEQSGDRGLAVLAHLSAIIAMVVSAGWLSFVGPLAIYYIYKDKNQMVRQAAAGAFNFNLAIWGAFIVAWILLFTIILIPLSILIFLGAGILALVCHIQGAVKANRGEVYKYPFEIPVLK